MPWWHTEKSKEQLQSFLTMASDGDKWSASHPSHFTPSQRIPAGIWTPGHPAHSLVKCTNCTTPATFKKQYKNYCGKPEIHSGHIISLFTIKITVICDVMPCTLIMKAAGSSLCQHPPDYMVSHPRRQDFSAATLRMLNLRIHSTKQQPVPKTHHSGRILNS